MVHELSTVDRERVELLRLLQRQGYDFVTPTPSTHALIMRRRAGSMAADTRDVLGWNMPFEENAIDPAVFLMLEQAELAAVEAGMWRALARVSRLDDLLFLHSPFPTTKRDSVFFGPDSYRFANLIIAELPHVRRGGVIVDVGTGAGVGAIVAGVRRPEAQIIGTDVNPSALALAAVNAAAAGVMLDGRCGDILAGFEGPIDVALANPPYIIDAERRAYRDGGGMHGAELSLRMIAEILPRLADAGQFILYTGSAIVAGEDRLRAEAMLLARQHGFACRYREIDPDVFGEELAEPGYAAVERIAAVAAVFERT